MAKEIEVAPTMIDSPREEVFGTIIHIEAKQQQQQQYY
jgi:hypothetical protein